MRSASPLALAAGAGGAALLIGSFFPIAALPQGGTGAKAAVFLLLFAAALLAVWLLHRAGYSSTPFWTALLPVGLAFFLRAVLLYYVADDYTIFLSQWVATFRENGGFKAIKLSIGNYNVPYLYFLAAISYLPIPDLYLIKLFSIFFDVVLAWGGLRLVRHFTGPRSTRPLICFCALLLLPTVVLNGSLWGQCDALYGALTLHALADALENRPKASAALLGVAFSFKLQTVFILPLWAVLWIARRTRFRDLLLFPAAYALTCLPALLLGKPLGDILGVYVGQTQEGAGTLNYNCASIFSMVPYGTQLDEALWARVGILAAFALVLVLLVLAALFRDRLDDKALLLCGVVLTVGVPFLLPYMHDRYYFLADVLTVALACILPWNLPLAVLVQLASFSAYLTYLRMKYTLVISLDGHLFTMLLESLLILAALVTAIYVFTHHLTVNPRSSGEKNKKSRKCG